MLGHDVGHALPELRRQAESLMVDVGTVNIVTSVFDPTMNANVETLTPAYSGRMRVWRATSSATAEAAGQQVTVILGFNTADEVFYAEEFAALGAEVRITTVDGSVGTKGFVTDAFPADYDYFYTCGPLPMLRAVYDRSATSGQFSFEERMGCGFGACMGCSCKTKYGNKRICKDGPVLVKEEIVW